MAIFTVKYFVNKHGFGFKENQSRRDDLDFKSESTLLRLISFHLGMKFDHTRPDIFPLLY